MDTDTGKTPDIQARFAKYPFRVFMLTDTQLRNAKPQDKPYKLSDGNGLHLLVMPTGSKLWQFRYRLDDRERLTGLGPYPEISLAEARDKRDQYRKLVRNGEDPIALKRAAKAQRKVVRANTFKAAADSWFAIWQVGRSERYAQSVMRRLEADTFPALGKRPLAEITVPEIVAVLQTIEKRDAPEIARRTYQKIAQIYRYAIAHGLCERSPAADIRPAEILAARKRVNFARIDNRELPDLLRRIDAYQGTPVTRLAMKLLALTFVRTSELIGARWEEFDWEAKLWRIPGERMKMKTPHIVPLSRQAIEVLEVLKTVTIRREFLFPGERNPKGSISNNTILKALERMGYKGRMTGHGFRGLASTILHEQGYPHEHIELQLAHQERNRVSASYNHAQYLNQRASLMQAWADYLDRVKLVPANHSTISRTADGR